MTSKSNYTIYQSTPKQKYFLSVIFSFVKRKKRYDELKQHATEIQLVQIGFTIHSIVRNHYRYRVAIF